MARTNNPQPALGKAVQQLRTDRGISQEDLAHDSDVTTGTLSVIERGRSNPSWGTVKSIARALDISLTELAALAEKLDR